MTKVTTNLFILYKKAVSPLLFQILGNGCRYQPTCSEYAREAVEKYGFKKGSFLATKRIVRCHPLTKHPHFDPVPANPKS